VENNRPDIALIRKYLNGELNARAMYELERRAQDDPYLMDVMMGMEMGNATEDEAALSAVDQRILKRIQPLQTKKMIPWKSWGIAASVLIGLSVFGTLFFRQPDQVPVTAADQQVVQEDHQTNTPGTGEADQTTTIRSSATARSHSPVPKQVPDAEVLNPSASAVVTSIQSKTDSNAIAKGTGDHLSDVAIVGYSLPENQSLADVALAKTYQAAATKTALAGKIAGLEVKSSRTMKVNANVPLQVSGIVTDAEGKYPLAGVAVRADKTGISTSTDAAGKFTLAVPSGTEQLQVAMIGYNISNVGIKGNDSLHIPLNPNQQSLSEVVVTGFSRRKEKATPLLGWKAYTAYLKANAKTADGKGGMVTVAFIIDSSGIPAQVTIKKGLNEVVNKKAAELILNGPKWIGDSDGKPREITLKIKFY